MTDRGFFLTRNLSLFQLAGFIVRARRDKDVFPFEAFSTGLIREKTQELYDNLPESGELLLSSEFGEGFIDLEFLDQGK